MNRRQLIAAASAAVFSGAAAPSTRQRDLQGDIDIVRRALALHPGLYRYSTPAEVEERLALLEKTFTAARTSEAHYLILSRFLATIRCGHSYCNFFNQSKSLASALFDRKTRLPFYFVWLEGRMVVTADPSGLGVPVGAEVLTVNDVPAPDLLKALMPYARADGHNDAKRAALLGVTGIESIEFFDVFHGLVFGAPAGGSYHLVLRLANGEVTQRELPAVGLTERRAQMKVRDYSGTEPFWTWTLRPDGIAVLTMPNWAMFNSQWEWRTWLDERLNSLPGHRGLIIDLRDNEGGNDCGDEILARLTASPITRPGAELLVRFQRTPRDLDRHLDTWDNSFRTLGVGATPVAEGFYRLTGEHANDTILPRAPRLDIRTAALIGPVNSSATFNFADKARASGLVRLFGETTGGNQRGINGGCFFFVRLPASRLEFDLPLIGYFPPGHPPDAGLAPDVDIRPTAADLAKAYDPTLEAAVEWVIAAKDETQAAVRRMEPVRISASCCVAQHHPDC
jgi:hypothetical protein